MKLRGQLLHNFPLNLGSKAQELSGHALVRTEVIFLLNVKFYFFAPKFNIEIEPEKRIRFQKGYCILSFLLGAGPPRFSAEAAVTQLQGDDVSGGADSLCLRIWVDWQYICCKPIGQSGP